MLSVLTALHVLICVGLIIVVLLQTGRGTGMASVFGGGGSGALMGGKGFGGVLARATAVLAILFMLTSITLSLMPRGVGEAESVLGGGSEEGPGAPASEQPATGPSMPDQGAPQQAPAQPPSGQ
jgi:preprotein translocase subunit SecG